MIALDTNILTELLLGNPSFKSRLLQVPFRDQAIPIIVVEELIRGRLNVIRQAESGKAKVRIEYAYQLFQDTIEDLRHIQILSYTSKAESQFRQWRQQGIRVSTHDLRIAAICIVYGAKLISKNRRDFEMIPGFQIEYWG